MSSTKVVSSKINVETKICPMELSYLFILGCAYVIHFFKLNFIENNMIFYIINTFIAKNITKLSTDG